MNNHEFVLKEDPSDATLRQIYIQSSWGGLGEPCDTELLIQNDHGIYRVDGAEVQVPAVQLLLITVREAVIRMPSLTNLGLTKPWLKDNANAIVRAAKTKQEYDSTYWKIRGGTRKQKSLFKSSYADPAFVAKVLPELFQYCSHTDDYPGVKVTITFMDGSTTVVSSDSQGEFILPWKLVNNDTESETFNRNISTAVVSLMPGGATNRDRISGERFALDLAAVVMDDIEEKWKLLG